MKISAKVIGIEKETRTITLKGPKGKVVDIVAGDKVRNFDQIKLGDMVVVRYAEALTLELKKAASGSGEVTVVEEAKRAKLGDRPGVAGGRQVSALAEVVAVDPKASTITIKGPKGNEVTLDVMNPDQFKVVKVGRPDRSDLHRSDRAERRAGSEAGEGKAEVSPSATRRHATHVRRNAGASF